MEVEAKKAELDKIDRLEELFEKLNKAIVEKLLPNVESSYKLFNSEIESIKQKVSNIESKQVAIDNETDAKISELKLYIESEIERTKKGLYEELEKLRAETRDVLYEYAATVNSKLEEIMEIVKEMQANVRKGELDLVEVKDFDVTLEYETGDKGDTSGVRSPRLL